MISRTQRRHPAGCIAAMLFAWLAIPALCLADENPVPSASCSSGEAIIVSLDLDHGVLRGAGLMGRHVRIERVTDVRGGDPCAAGFTVKGALRESRTPLALDRPVAEYLRTMLDRLIDPTAAAASDAVPVAIEIEQFDMDYAKSWMGAGDGAFEARCAVVVLTAAGPAHAGWIQARETSPKAFSVTGAQKASVYPGIVALARGLDDPALPLERYAGSAPASGTGETPPVIGTIAPAPPATIAPRRTVTTGYKTPIEMRTQGHPLWRFIYMTPNEAETDLAFKGFSGFGLGGVLWWLNNRAGLEGEIGFISAKGTPRALPSDWTVRSSSLEAWAIPLSTTMLYRMTGRGGSPNFAPYVGVGTGFLMGVERMKLDAESSVGETYTARLAALRGAFEGHGVLGADFHVSDALHGMIESRWTQSGHGFTAEPVDTNDPDDVAASNLLHSIIRRSNYNFTGWGILVGVRMDIK